MKLLSVLTFAAFLALAAGQASEPRSRLEKALTAAYNARFEDGSWALFFGGDTGLIAGDFCPGPSVVWQYPEWDSDDNDNSDDSSLDNALRRNNFKCGITRGTLALTNPSEPGTNPRAIIDARRPAFVNGLLVDFFGFLARSMADQYDVPFRIDWNADFETDDDVFEAVRNGDIDAACGYYLTGSAFKLSTNETGRLVNAFSLMNCASFLQGVEGFSPTTKREESFSDLVSSLNADKDLKVCVSAPGEGSGAQQLCSQLLSQYVTHEDGFKCTAMGEEAFTSDDCHAVLMGTPPSEREFREFVVPAFAEFGTFFQPLPGPSYDFSGASAVSVSFSVLALIVMSLLWI